MTNKKNHLALYLKNYAEPETTAICQLLPDDLQFEHCLVIPAYNESIDFLERIKKSTLSQQPLLIILVINQPDNIKSEEKNQQLWLETHKIGELQSEHEHCHLTHWKGSNTYLLTIDHFSHQRRLPQKQGVGLARKIGCDIACALVLKGTITNNWVHTSDADTTLPKDFLSRTPLGENYSAAIYPFKHIHSSFEQDSINQATFLYEQSLNYYVDGLSYAGSPYAYHSLGSCIAINLRAYAQVRGFPKRAGGEDFYLLNKLRKLGEIKQLTGEPLTITARLSDRAPFGTGPAVSKIVNQKLTSDSYHYYNPLAFKQLKILLMHFKTLFEAKEKPESWLKQCAPESQSALLSLGIHSFFEHIKSHATNNEECIKQSNDWFDAFKTLKFIHELERTYKKSPLESAINELKGMIKKEKEKRP